MRRWIKFWLSGWRSEPVVLLSPLSVPAVRAALIEGSTSYLRTAFMFGGGEGGYRVVGWVGERRIKLEAGRVGVRNSWRPVLHGRLESDGSGCRLVGTMGWSYLIMAFSALWLTMVCCAFLGLVIRAFVVAGRGEATGADFLVCLGPLGFMLFFFGLTTWGVHLGRGDARYLRSWLAERLRTAGSGIPGYQPWPGDTP